MSFRDRFLVVPKTASVTPPTIPIIEFMAANSPIGDALEEILSSYSEAQKTLPFSQSGELRDTFRHLQSLLTESEVLQRHLTVQVSWSIGKGNWAHVPWVALLDFRETNSTQHGVYAVYLFRRDMSGVYLTFNQGVTEPKRRLGDTKGRRFLAENASELRKACHSLAAAGFSLDNNIDLRVNAGVGADYEGSTIAYKLYSREELPSDQELLRDLDAVLTTYDEYLQGDLQGKLLHIQNEVIPTFDLREIHASFSDRLRQSHISFGQRHAEVTRAFVASLATKRFVILTGLSGSGKTQIGLRFGEWLGSERLRIVPVRPDWTGTEAVFGFEDALQATINGRRAWHTTAPLQFILRAAQDLNQPYLLLLDEMNLAHVERYFADVLSGMESGAACVPNLRQEADGCWRLVPNEPPLLPFPDNLFIVGTVNVDETTYMFSPKVLDRANTLEFRVDSSELMTEARKPESCPEGSPELVRGFLEISRDSSWHLTRPATGLEQFADHLRHVHQLLNDGGFEFGHRVFYEAVRFASMLESAGDPALESALDLQILQKVLPRLHGSRRRLEPTLCALGQFCLELKRKTSQSSQLPFDPLAPTNLQPLLPRSFEKIRRMTRNLRANQFASFTE